MLPVFTVYDLLPMNDYHVCHHNSQSVPSFTTCVRLSICSQWTVLLPYLSQSQLCHIHIYTCIASCDERHSMLAISSVYVDNFAIADGSSSGYTYSSFSIYIDECLDCNRIAIVFAV